MEGTESALGSAGTGCVVVAAATAVDEPVTGTLVVTLGAMMGGGGGADATC